MIQNRQTRRFPRFQIRGVTGAVTAPRQAEVLDLSLGGALVEHQGQLRVGAPCFIGLPTNGSAEEVLQAIVRSFGAPKDRRPRKKRSPRKSSGAM